MRQWTLEQIKSRRDERASLVNQAVGQFRAKSREQGWTMKRTRPRDADEIRALNEIARRTLREALAEGTVRYDRERRVLILARLSGSKTGSSTTC